MGNKLTSYIYVDENTDTNNEVNESVSDNFTDDTIPQVSNNPYPNVKYNQCLDTIFEDTEERINKSHSDKDTQTIDKIEPENIDSRSIIESRKYFIRKFNIDNIDIDISDTEIEDTLSIPEDDRDENILFTSLDEIVLLKETIINLEKELSNKNNEITQLSKKYIKLQKNKNREIKKLEYKMNEYIDEYDELYLDNLRLKRKNKSKVCEIFTPLNYTNIDYNDSNYLTI
jgi:hypothetical protein